MTDSIDTSEREAEEPAFINLPVREMSDEPAPQQPADALRTALQLALEATPEQLPAALDALRDQLGLTTSSPPCAMRYDFDGHGWRYIDAGSGSDWMTRVPGAEPVYDGPTRQVASINYTPGEWFDATSVDLMQQFFESRLPAIRETARRHGYAIGVHGSMRRDMDLIAAPWCDGASDPDTLAHAIADAACGITIASSYDWEQKPAGRVATSIPICWTHRPGVPGDGHIDLSVMPQAAPPAPQAERTALDYPAGVPKPAPIGHCRPNGIVYDLPPLTFTAAHLCEALEFFGGEYGDADDPTQVCIALRDEGHDTDGEMRPRGLYVWLKEYPEEGALHLPGTTPPAPLSKPQPPVDHFPDVGKKIAVDIEAAAKVLAERMDYPWQPMPEQGRQAMRGHAKAVIEAAFGTTGD